MNADTRAKWIVAAVTAYVCGLTYAGDKPSVGRKIGEFLRKTDARLQQELDRRPDLRNGISRGIDTFSDNLIDAVTPDADANVRRVQKAAVQMMLNPSKTGSDQAFRDMQGALAETVSGSSRACAVFTNSPGPTRLALPAGIIAMGQADWHARLWAKANRGVLATSASVGAFLPWGHAKLAAMLADAGLSSNVAATCASIIMALGGLLGLLLLVTIPRRGLKRKLRKLRRELAQQRTTASRRVATQ